MTRTTVATLTLSLILTMTSAAWNQARPAERHSPHGSVPFGTPDGVAYSPNGRMMAREVAPRDQGRIGIFDADGKPAREIAVGETGNDLKGLAWSPDSTTLAVMYHHNIGSYIALYDAATGKRVARIGINKPYNYMKFDPSGRSLAVRTKEGYPETVSIPQ